ncbi:MAG: sigma-70 family RNA polymerase sigma factor [Polyangiaceae bacterium]|nr:sigma-70 family RNA polymerase sigma factor [Polyangiaceae bacterium]
MPALAVAHPLPLTADAPASAERALLEACRRGGPGEFRRLVERYEGLVWGFLARMVRDRALAEDLSQETFLRAYRALGAFDPSRGAKLSTWLLTIARNVALDAARRGAAPTTELDDTAVDAATPESIRAARELGEAIARAAASLSPAHREVLVLAEVQGLSMDEIAVVVAAPSNTVKQRLSRARERMRALLAEWEADR